MKKIIFSCLFLTSFLFAENEVSLLIKNFNKVANKDVLSEINSLKQNDKYFNMAIDYLTKKSMMTKTKVIAGDAEEAEADEQNNKPIKYKFIRLPNYSNALQEFRKSVDKYNNPLSAYIALQIVKTKIPPTKIEDMKYKRKYIELLYKTTHSCSAYIDYSDVLFNGIAGSPNIQKAKKVLDETNRCLNSATDWEKSIIQMKKDRIQFKLEHDLK